MTLQITVMILTTFCVLGLAVAWKANDVLNLVIKMGLYALGGAHVWLALSTLGYTVTVAA